MALRRYFSSIRKEIVVSFHSAYVTSDLNPAVVDVVPVWATNRNRNRVGASGILRSHNYKYRILTFDCFRLKCSL